MMDNPLSNSDLVTIEQHFKTIEHDVQLHPLTNKFCHNFGLPEIKEAKKRKLKLKKKSPVDSPSRLILSTSKLNP